MIEADDFGKIEYDDNGYAIVDPLNGKKKKMLLTRQKPWHKKGIITLDKEMIHHPSFLTLTAKTIQVYLAMRCRLIPTSGKIKKQWDRRKGRKAPTYQNNGQIIAPISKLVQELNMTSQTVRNAFTDLQQKGFIKLIKKGGKATAWNQYSAHEWAIIDNWKSWDPNKKKPRKERVKLQ